MKKRGVFLILFLLFIPLSFGLGLQYSKTGELFFEPNLQFNKDFNIIGYRDGMSVNVSVTGGLSEYATLSDLEDGGLGKKFSLSINFPEYLSPGIHSLIVRAQEVPLNHSGTIAIAIETGKNIEFWVLDPGKFALFDFFTSNLNVNDSVDFVIDARNYGEQTIYYIYGIIDILFNEKIVKTIRSEHIGIESKERKESKAEFDSMGLVPGEYVARANISWDGNWTIIEKEFRIGSLNIIINNFTKEVIKANIAEIFIEIESKWNNDVEGINAEVFIGDVSVGKSLDHNLEKWGKIDIPVYVNLKDVEVGEHEIEIILNYEEKSSFLTDTINILAPPKKVNWIRIGLVSFIIILIISLIDLLVITLKKKK